MTHLRHLSSVPGIVLLVVVTTFAQDQGSSGLDLSWNTIDGGGGTSTSTGGEFELSGTIGQCDAGIPMTGGTFELTGGFWSDAAHPCVGDTDNDRDVDINDLRNVILQWNTSGPAGDIDANGNVDINDLRLVILNWGPCPESIGSCCFLDETCSEMEESDCTTQNGIFKGVGTTCATTQCQIANDECENATEVFEGETIVDNSPSTRSPEPGLKCFLDTPSLIEGDQWFTFTAPDDGQLTVDTCLTFVNGSAVDNTMLSVYFGTCSEIAGGSALEYCDDDACMVEPGGLGLSRLSNIQLSSGETVIIRVGTIQGAPNGEITLRLNFVEGTTVGACCALDGNCLGTMILHDCDLCCGTTWSEGEFCPQAFCNANPPAPPISPCVAGNSNHAGSGSADQLTRFRPPTWNNGSLGMLEDFLLCADGQNCGVSDSLNIDTIHVEFVDETAPGVGTISAISQLRVRVYDLHNRDMSNLHPVVSVPFLDQVFSVGSNVTKTLCGEYLVDGDKNPDADIECWTIDLNTPLNVTGDFEKGEYAIYFSFPELTNAPVFMAGTSGSNSSTINPARVFGFDAGGNPINSRAASFQSGVAQFHSMFCIGGE